ncbi:stalk domain-containing protein [Paenibacillus ihuae]
MVPKETVFEKPRATIGWDQASQTVTATKGTTKIVNPPSH